ncbi:hypothetical protein CIW50_19640 [Tardiphaga sp. P9-11]|nr:hypothetical protein CIW50_19640 [Tardiphaga sp. P9-11]
MTSGPYHFRRPRKEFQVFCFSGGWQMILKLSPLNLSRPGLPLYYWKADEATPERNHLIPIFTSRQLLQKLLAGLSGVPADQLDRRGASPVSIAGLGIIPHRVR